MVDKAEFFRVADEILAEGRQPSQRSIRDRLAKGGSFSDLGPLFVEWTAKRGLLPRPTKEDLPEKLLNKLATFAAEIWRDGHQNGFIVAKNERDNLAAERDALRQALIETSARADALEEMMGLRKPGFNGNREEPVQAPGVSGEEPVLASAESRDSDGWWESDGFWDSVLQEVAGVLGTRELEPRAIIAEMKKETVDEASKRDGAWGPGRLAHKMRQKARK